MITDIIERLTHYSFIAIKFIVSLILGIIFILIPTLLFNPHTQIPHIEADTCIDIPTKYEVAKKYEDFLAFEVHQEITLQFQDQEFNEILDQLESPKCENGTWIMKNNTLEFELKNGFVEEKKYIFKAKVLKKDKTIEYTYSDL